MTKQQLILISIIALIIFFFTLEIKTFGGYTIPILLIVGIIYFFLGRYIIRSFQNGTSYFIIIIFVIIALLISIFAYGLNSVLENKKIIDSQWASYKCKPYIMPFAGVLIGPKGTNPGSNFTQCMWDINKNFFAILISPFTDMIQMILDILKGLVADIQNIRKIVSYLRTSVRSITEDIYQRLYETYGRIAFIVKKIMRIFSKLFQIFENLFDVMLYSFYSLASMWNGPIGGMARGVGRFFCFGKDTYLLLESGEKIRINHIKIGDKLHNGNEITAIMKFDASNVPMYNYNNIIVSGEHLVFHGNKWKRIENVDTASPINYNKKYIYCLNTDEGIIHIGNNIFTDYQETSNRIIGAVIYKMIIFYLNNGRFGIENELNDIDGMEYEDWGFDKNTIIKMSDRTHKKIANIQINDNIVGGGNVKGIIILNGENTTIYKYGGNLISGTCIVLENHKWKPIFKSIHTIKTTETKKILYHLITENGVIECKDGNIFRDYEQSANTELNKHIDKYMENYLNDFNSNSQYLISM